MAQRMKIRSWGLGVTGLAAAGAIVVAVVGVGGSASAQVGPEEKQSSGERYRELLADELGITVDELSEAQEAARDKLIDEAVAAGKLSQERGDALKARDIGQWRMGIGGHGMGEKLHGAVVSVFEAVADVVGLPVEDLRERLTGGESLVDIAASQNIDEATLKAELVSELTAMIEQAVVDGDISQDKADMVLEHLEEIVDRAIDFEVRFDGRMRFDGRGFERFFTERHRN